MRTYDILPSPNTTTVMFTQKYRLAKVTTRTLRLDGHEIELSRKYLLEFLLAMKERLQKTDALIDAVVYRLYGLTEEEIRVVEGR